jgi:hypothetical protein
MFMAAVMARAWGKIEGGERTTESEGMKKRECLGASPPQDPAPAA